MTTQFAPNNMALPPPVQLDLLDGSRTVGWLKDSAIGFRGFANENEAAGAAWVAHRTLARRLARRHGGPVSPIDVEPLSLAQAGDRSVVLASGRPIATLVLPGSDSPSGRDSFGFEIQVPPPAANELSVRSLAHRTYRTLRRSGVRWAMWEQPRVNLRRAARRRQPVWVATRGPSDSSPRPIVFISKFILTGIAVMLGALLIAAAPPTVTIPIGIALGAGLVASVLMTLAERWRATRVRRPRRSAATSAAHSGGGARPRGDDPSDEAMRERGWLALGAVSMAVLLLAAVVPEELAAALAAIGLAGLVVFRLTAAWAGWTPDRAAGVTSSSSASTSARRSQTTPRAVPRPPARRAGAAWRNATLPWPASS